MKDIDRLWEETCRLLRAQMNEVSYITWIKEALRPVRQEGNVVVLAVTAPYMMSMVSNRYTGIISNCLSEAAGCALTASIVTEADADKQAAAPNAERSIVSQQLNPRYTFDQFVVGNGNRFAHAASLAVAETPSKAYNPLFIYGGVGLGKTHLMHAIGHYILQQDPTARLMCVTSEQFTNELIAAIKEGQNMEFRNRFRNVDVLLVDDIQFIAGKDSTQEEFFHTFNALHSAGKQIVLTSDRPPKDIARLEERLCSRFEWGLICDIQRPDIETRIAILRKKAEQEHYQVEDDVLELIATRVDSNIRELEGSLLRLVAYSQLNNKPISVALCEEALRETFERTAPRPVTADRVIRTVAGYYNLDPAELTGSSRRREVAVPRQIAMYLTRDMTGLSLPQIGQAFGGKDHSTVLYSCNQVAGSIRESATSAHLVDDLRRMVQEGD